MSDMQLSLGEKHAQLPAVDMLKVQGSLWCYSIDSTKLGCTVTVPKNLHMQICGVWMAAWVENAECQLQAVDQVFFAVCD